MYDLQTVFLECVGPYVFRIVWWHYLDKSQKRIDFPSDLFDAITTGFMQLYREHTGGFLPSEAKPIVSQMIKGQLESISRSSITNLMPKFLDYEKFVRSIVERRNDSEFNRLFAVQYDYFCGRISKLTPELVSTVRLINEEFLIWLKTHPDHSERIHADAFEQLTGEILTSHGFEIEFTGRIKNKSADLLAIKSNCDGSETKYLVECKRYGASKPVGIAILNAVVGASYRAKISHAMLVTTSSFTSNVYEANAELEDFRLELHDGEQICRWLANYQLKDFGLWLPEGWQDTWKLT